MSDALVVLENLKIMQQERRQLKPGTIANKFFFRGGNIKPRKYNLKNGGLVFSCWPPVSIISLLNVFHLLLSNKQLINVKSKIS